MPISRGSVVKLASFAGATAVAYAARHLGLDPGIAASWIGETLGLIHAGAHAGAGHVFVDLVHDVANGAEGHETARGVQNRDLHRMIGETIARILEREALGAPGGRFGVDYLNSAAAAFRGLAWMEVELTAPDTAVGEEQLPQYFSGDAEAIKKAPVLTEGEWVALVEKVSAPTRTQQSEGALSHAATMLRQHFAFELWESAKTAWKKDDLAWPALILRLLSLIAGSAGDAAKHSEEAANQLGELRSQVAKLRDDVVSAAGPAIAKAGPADIMLAAFHEYHSELNAQIAGLREEMRGGFQEMRSGFQGVMDALEHRRVAPVKERWIGLPNTAKEILARDAQAEALLGALRATGPGIVSITAPPGFGKTAVFALAVRMARSQGDPPEAELNGIAVLDATVHIPGIAELANRLGLITGLQEAAARFASAAAEHPDAALRALFFNFLSQAGKVWLVVENAEKLLAPKAESGVAADFRDLLADWCRHDHAAKLLLLTRHALHPPPECHRRLSEVEAALLGGLPEDAAVKLLRRCLADSRFAAAGEALLRQIVPKLHRVPLAIEQFAGYLKLQEQGVELDQAFIARNDLLRLPAAEQILAITGESLRLLDEASLGLLRVTAWAAMPVPLSGLMALAPGGGALLTRLVRSNQLFAREGTAAEGRSFDMHPLVREAVADLGGAALDFGRIYQVFLGAGNAEQEKTQFRPALALYTLAERAARVGGKPEQVARAVMNRGTVLANLGRLEEAVAAYDASIALRRALVEQEQRQELRHELAGAIMNRGNVLADLGKLEEAVAAYDESIAIYRVLVEQEHRQDLGKDLRNELALAIMNRGSALRNLGKLEEAVAAYDASIALYRVLVEQEHRQELRHDLARALYNLALAREKQNAVRKALDAAREARELWEAMVKEGRQHLERDFEDARNLEAELAPRTRSSGGSR